MSQPLVTIGVPVYNGGRLLAGALDSLLAQTFEDYEILILDNASTDDTEDIARKYAERDPRIRYVRNERNIGSSPNFNRAAELANGKYFRWQACDDLIAPTYLEKTVPVLEENPDTVLVFTKTHVTRANNSPLPFDTETQRYLLPGGKTWWYDKHAEDALTDADPVVRFRALMWSTIAATVTYGLFRTTELQKTELIRLHGNERLLLAELALKGRFRRVDEKLFYRSIHESDTHSLSRREIFEYQTGQKWRFIHPPWKSALNFLGVVSTSDLSLQQKMHCRKTVLAYSLRLESVRNLFIPGPDNYFGINFSSRRSLKEASNA